MSFTRQFLALLRIHLGSLPARPSSALTIVVGVTCAVGALVSMLAMGTGARPGIRKGSTGDPIVVFESATFIEGRRRGTDVRIYFPVTGVTKNLEQYLPELRFTEGRMFAPGLHELIASNPCARQFRGFELGDQRLIHGIAWTIVGRFDLGQAQQCTVYGDVDGLMAAFRRNTYTAVAVTLQSPEGFAGFHAAVAADPALKLEALRESDAIAEQFKELNAILHFTAYFVGSIMALGATLGAVNALYAIVDSRRRELATVRALGFGPGPIVASVLAESILLAVPGALLGSALAWLLFNGQAASPLGYSLHLAVTPTLILLGILWALGMGALGGVLPALRAANVPVTTALRAV